MTAETASEQSAVPVRYVRMFEEGRYPVVSDPAYLAHFVRRYATYLGLDAEQASRDLIAETEPETALRRAGKLAAEPRVESSMNRRDGGQSDRRPAKAKPDPKSRTRRFKFDAGPISLLGAAVTLGLFLLTIWQGKHSEKKASSAGEEVVQSEVAAAATAGPEQPTAAPAPTAEPTMASAAAAEPPTAPPPEAAPEAPPQAAAPPPAAPPPAAAAPAPKPAVEPPPIRRPAPAPPAAAKPAPVPAPAAEAPLSGADAAKQREREDATNRASDELRAQQLERLKAKEQGGTGAPPAAEPAAAAEAPPPAQ